MTPSRLPDRTIAPKEHTVNLDATAHDIRTAQRRRTLIEPITARALDLDNATAYAIAHRVHAMRLREGSRSIGRKIGFTNRNIWPEYRVYEPIWGYVYDTTVQFLPSNGGECSLEAFALPRIEPEIIFHFHAAPPLTNDARAILACVDWVAHGYEIVQSHFRDWKFKVADTIADSALHGTLLVGETHAVEKLGSNLVERLATFTIDLACNGHVRDRGRGANVLDSPLLALAYLIGVLARQSEAMPIQAGELVTTGTLTAALPIAAGETWTTALDGLNLPGMNVRFV
jgi:2-keto-4-pentenoate hydratase